MKLCYLAFSDRGLALAQRLAGALGGQAVRCGGPVTLAGWTAEHFVTGAGLVYVGACGIAVRAVAPHLVSKAQDPAVVAVDERGHFAVPLVSGHLGGANALARSIARVCGAVPVLTTATDAGGLFPVDDWARAQGCAIPNPEQIKAFSTAILAGKTCRIYSDWPVAGIPPAGVELTEDKSACDAAVTLNDPGPGPLWIAPRAAVLGMGCRRGVPAGQLEAASGWNRLCSRPLQRPASRPRRCPWSVPLTSKPGNRGFWTSAGPTAGHCGPFRRSSWNRWKEPSPPRPLWPGRWG